MVLAEEEIELDVPMGIGIENEGFVRGPGEQEETEVKPRIINSGVITEGSKERRTCLIKQGLKMFLVSFGMWSLGSMIVFPSVLASDLRSLLTLSSLPGLWIMAPLMVLWGRRPSMLISGMLLVFGWLGVILLPGNIGMLVARCISGFATGCTSVSLNTYAIEMADSDVRGAMFIIINNEVLAGQVMTMAFGTFARYFVVAIIDILFPIIFLIAVIWLPESPSFLVVKGRNEDARKVLIGLRGPAADINTEIKAYEEMNQSTKGEDGGMRWKQLLEPHILRSIFVIGTLFLIMHFTGYLVVSANASRIFKAAGSTIDDKIASVIVTVVQLCAGIVASLLIDRIGRRKSLFLSYTAMCIPLTMLAVYVGLVDETENVGQETYGWVPLVCLMVSQAGVVVGANPIPYIVSNEYFPTTLRSQACSICYSVGMLCSFAILQLYTSMMNGLTQTGLYAFYASFCAIGVPFTYFFVRETMGEQVV